jgi:hypothetical protein
MTLEYVGDETFHLASAFHQQQLHRNTTSVQFILLVAMYKEMELKPSQLNSKNRPLLLRTNV